MRAAIIAAPETPPPPPRAAQRAKITEKVHKPPQNHYIEWPVFSDIALNYDTQGEKGRTCKKIQNSNWILSIFFL